MANPESFPRATPRPWKVNASQEPIRIVDDSQPTTGGVYACAVAAQTYGSMRGRENAALIVRAVNAWDSPDALRERLREIAPDEKKPDAHDALVAALEAAVEVVHTWHGDVAWEIYRDHSPEMKPIREALAGVKR